MSKTKQMRVRVESTNVDNTDRMARTEVFLVNGDGKPVGRAILETIPGTGAHYKFPNAVEMLFDQPKTFM